MNDVLKLKLNDKIVEISYDDNGRYSLNDLYKASHATESKKPSKFLRYQDVTTLKLWELTNSSPYTEAPIVSKKVDRVTTTYASEEIFVGYANFISKEWGSRISYGLLMGEDVIELPSYEEVKNETSPQGVYLMKNEFGLHKIGVTCNIEARKSAIESSSGVSLGVIKYWEPSLFSDEYVSALSAEGMLHERFANFRKKGEWFDFNESDEKIVEVIDQFLEIYAGAKRAA